MRERIPGILLSTVRRVVAKNHFSAVPEGGIFAVPGGDRAQFIVSGTEAHGCVQQTVLDLLDSGRRVFVVEGDRLARNGRL